MVDIVDVVNVEHVDEDCNEWLIPVVNGDIVLIVVVVVVVVVADETIVDGDVKFDCKG